MARDFFSRFRRQCHSLAGPGNKQRRRRGVSRSVDLRFEALEDRRLLAAADFDVTFNPAGVLPPGTLLPSGHQGLVISHFGSDPTSETDAFAVAEVDGGKLLVAGRFQPTGVSTQRSFFVARYNTDGSLDTTFGAADADGINGIAIIDVVPGEEDSALDMAVDSQDRIILVGTAGLGRDIGVVRLTASGALDLSFGTGGIVVTSSGADQFEANAVAIDENDYIVVAGLTRPTASSSDFLVVRYTDTGVLDTSFDGDGIVTTGFNTGDDLAFDVAIQSDGQIVVGGTAAIVASVAKDFALARYNVDGSLDTTFDGDGKVMTAVAISATANDTIEEIAIESDGQIVAAGSASNGITVMARYNSNGALDTAGFNSGGASGAPGTLIVNIDNLGATTEQSLGLGIQQDGKYVLAGRFIPGAGLNQLLVERVTTSGVLDTTFNATWPGGRATDVYSGTISEIYRDVIVQSDGKIVATGQGNNNDMVIARYLSGQAIANPGGPYFIDEPGGSEMLSGSAIGTGTLTFTWDLDDDGIFGEAAGPGLYGDENGATPTFTVSGIDGPAVFPVTLHVTSSVVGEIFVDQSTTVTVVNVAPTAALANGGPVNEGSTGSVSFSGQFDPSPADTTAGFRYSYDFNNDGSWEVGDGSYGGSVAGDSQVVPASFLADGAATVTVKGRILDDDGGFTDYTTAITVNNVAPTLTISGATNVDEGAVYTLSLASLDPGADTITSWSINWGDGIEVVGGNPTSATHTYADGTIGYTISATATDEDGTFSSNSISVTVDDVAPTSTISGAADVDEGDVYTLGLSSFDPGTDTITSWTINWGDGTEVISGNPASVMHTYADGDNSYLISAAATNEDGTFAADNLVPLLVHNVAPTLTISGAADVDEGATYTLNLTSNDPGADTIANWTIDWGDGIEVVSGDPASVAHVYADGDAGYSITATATDEDGTFAALAAVAVLVHNVAPTLAISGNSNVNEGAVYTLGLSSNDPGDDTITSWTIDWGDGIEVVGGDPASATHVYADGPNGYTISATATDEDGTYSSNSISVTVDNVDPTANAGGPYFTFDDTTITLSGSGSDPAGVLDPLTFTWDLDGDSVFGETGAGALQGDEVGANPVFNPIGLSTGAYTVTLRVSDGDGGVTDDTAVVNVLAVGTLLIDGTLYVVGSDTDNDHVFIFQHNGNIKVYASFNDDNPVVFDADDVTTIDIRVRGGNDVVVVHHSVSHSTTIDGGNGFDKLTGGSGRDLILGGSGDDLLAGQGGDDVLLAGSGRDDLFGGSGDDVLVAGDADDMLFGGSGRDLLIGGQDNDWLEGGSDDDILIGGVTIHDNDVAALDAVMAIWTSSMSFADRVETLTADGGLLEAGVAVFDDDDTDILIGGAGRDLVFADITFSGCDRDIVAFSHQYDYLVPVN